MRRRPDRQRRSPGSLVPVLAASVVLGACAAAAAAAGDAPLPPAAAASRDAVVLLARLALPPGATALRTVPAGVAGGPPPVVPDTPDVVTREAYYALALPLHAVLSYIDAHPPSGSRPTTSGSSTAPGKPTSYFVAFSFPPTSQLSQRTVGATVVAQSPSRTVVVAASDDVWLTMRPASERVPAAARVATVTITPPLSAPGTRRASARQIVVTASSRVTRLIAAVDALPAAQPGVTSCPEDDGAMVSVAFSASRGGAVLALVQAGLTGCGRVTFTLHGHTEPALTDGPTLGQAVQRILGVSLPAR